jgi:hypothetical protein
VEITTSFQLSAISDQLFVNHANVRVSQAVVARKLIIAKTSRHARRSAKLPP